MKKVTSHRTKRIVIMVLTTILAALTGQGALEALSSGAEAIVVGQ
jgi:hypothetical protein